MFFEKIRGNRRQKKILATNHRQRHLFLLNFVIESEPTTMSDEMQVDTLTTGGDLNPMRTANLWDSDEDVGDDSTPDINNRVLKAAEVGDLETLTTLIATDPQLVNCRDVDCYTPLHRACYNNHTEVIKFLLQHGADIHAESREGWRPLHSAAHWSQTEAAALLIEAGADINCRSHSGLAPVHLAAQQNNRPLLELFLYHPDIDLTVKTEAGDTPYDIAHRSSPLYRLFQNV